jgi:hypothetical protein
MRDESRRPGRVIIMGGERERRCCPGAGIRLSYPRRDQSQTNSCPRELRSGALAFFAGCGRPPRRVRRCAFEGRAHHSSFRSTVVGHAYQSGPALFVACGRALGRVRRAPRAGQHFLSFPGCPPGPGLPSGTILGTPGYPVGQASAWISSSANIPRRYGPSDRGVGELVRGYPQRVCLCTISDGGRLTRSSHASGGAQCPPTL